MMKKTFHILVIAVLALNLMGAWAFASLLDCGMECCSPGEWAGTTSYETPSCCQMSDVTCGFETGSYEELFDTAICCFTGAGHQGQSIAVMTNTIKAVAGAALPRYSVTAFSLQPSQSTPVYLSNASILC